MIDGVQQNRDRGRPDHWHPDDGDKLWDFLDGTVRLSDARSTQYYVDRAKHSLAETLKTLNASEAAELQHPELAEALDLPWWRARAEILRHGSRGCSKNMRGCRKR